MAEGAGATTLTVTATVNRAAPTTATEIPISVTANTATATTDYTATSATLTIAANARTGTATLTLTPVDDADAEADETVIIGGSVTGFTVTSAQVTILDNDEPAITLSFIDTSGDADDNFMQVNEDAGTVTFMLKASTGSNTAPTRNIAVTLEPVAVAGQEETHASAEAGDYKTFRPTYTFQASDFTLSGNEYTLAKSAELDIIDDLTVEVLQYINIAVDEATLARHVTGPGVLRIVVTDDDTAKVSYERQAYDVKEGEAAVVTIGTDAPVEFAFGVLTTSTHLPYEGSGVIPEQHRADYDAQHAALAAFAEVEVDYAHLTDTFEVPAFGTKQFSVRTAKTRSTRTTKHW